MQQAALFCWGSFPSPFHCLFTILAAVIIAFGSAPDLPSYQHWNVNLLTPLPTIGILPLLFALCTSVMFVIREKMHVSVAQHSGFLVALYEFVSLRSSFLVITGLLQVGKCVRILLDVFCCLYLGLF